MRKPAIFYWRQIFRELSEHRFLLLQLVRINFLEEFKKSSIGVLKSALAPVLGIVVWLLFAETGLFDPGVTAIPYAAYVILSMGIFTAFVNFAYHVGDVLQYHRNVITETQISFAVLYTQKMIHALLHYSIPLLSTVLILLIFGIPLKPAGLLLPVVLIPTMLLGAVVGCLLSIFQIVNVDLFTTGKRAVQAVVFVTPVIYSSEVKSELLQVILSWNPLTYLVGAARDLLTKGFYQHWEGFWWSTGMVLLAFALIFPMVVKHSNKIIEKIY